MRWFLVFCGLLISRLAIAAPQVLPDSYYVVYMEVVNEQRAAEPICRQLEAYQGLPEGQVLYGSCRTLIGRDAWLPWNKISYTEEGMAIMEKAIRNLTPEDHQRHFQGVPVDVFVKFIAAMNYFAVPDSIFHSRQRGEALVKALQKEPWAAYPDNFHRGFSQLVHQMEADE